MDSGIGDSHRLRPMAEQEIRWPELDLKSRELEHKGDFEDKLGAADRGTYGYERGCIVEVWINCQDCCGPGLPRYLIEGIRLH